MRYHYNNNNTTILIILRRRRQLTLLLIQLFLLVSTIVCKGNKPPPPYHRGGLRSAYEILGVDRHTATQTDIKKSYRKLCLQLHPDKNVDCSVEDRLRIEEEFKAVQGAYSSIGDEESRKQYDIQLRYQQRSAAGHYVNSAGFPFPFPSSSTNTSSQQFHPFEHFMYRQHQNMGFNPSDGRSASVLFDVMFGDMRNLHKNPFNDIGSIFETHVPCSLSELYKGVEAKKMVVKDGFLQRYGAALRGGVLSRLLLQAGLFSFLPLLMRTNVLISGIVSLCIVHSSLPRPSKLEFNSDIKRGWKGGTRLKFDHETGITIVFILKEVNDGKFIRRGNDLHTNVTISKSQMLNGCSLILDPLNENEPPIMVTINPNEISPTNQVIVIEHRGWPRKDGTSGDLHVQINVVSDKKAKDMEQKKMKRKSKKKFVKEMAC